MGWSESAVLAELRQKQGGHVVESVYKLPASRAAIAVIGGREYAVTGVDPEEMPSRAAGEIYRGLRLYK